jgi:hypothetical protein
MRKLILAALAAMVLWAAAAAPAGARATGATMNPVAREWNDDGSRHTGGETIGFTNVVRSDAGIRGTTSVSGLHPDGVYTFWIVAIEPGFDMSAPDFSKIFVALGNSAIVGQNGRATVHWSAAAGDSSIVTPVGAFFDGSLDQIDDLVVRVEIAYHGQVPEDGVVPAGWTENFWDGDTDGLCSMDPFMVDGLIAGQPHCPVFFASTDLPG